MRVLDLKGRMTKSQMRDVVGGKNEVIGEAIRELEAEGFISVTTGGPKTKAMLSSLTSRKAAGNSHQVRIWLT